MIEKALSVIYKKPIRINFSGRTDTGVHAIAQYIDFITEKDNIALDNLQTALNSLLPNDVAVLDIFNVNDEFHSRFSAIFRDYTYLIFNTKTPNPFYTKYSWFIPFELDINRMLYLRKYFVGYRDFSLVSNEPKDKSCFRNVYFLRIKRFKGFIIIHIRANSYLRGMVRNIVGRLVAFSKIGLKMQTGDNIIQGILENASLKAPPRGLFLTKVIYRRSRNDY